MVSMWETNRRIPPEPRLAAYARLFATPRSFSGKAPPRLLDDEDLTEAERERLRELDEELRDLRELARSGDGFSSGIGQPERVWRFSGNPTITIVCADMPEDERSKYADPRELNFVRASSFADLDALLDLFGHLRAENPGAMVRIRAAREFKKEEMSGHVVLLGGVIWNATTKWLSDRIALPVRQVAERDVFVVEDDHNKPTEFGIKLEGSVLHEDVGMFARVPNPQAPRYTLTICNGITTRGVRGAVLCFMSPDLRDRNEEYVTASFAGHASWGILMRVQVFTTGEPFTPDLTRKETRLFEWSNSDTGPRANIRS